MIDLDINDFLRIKQNHIRLILEQNEFDRLNFILREKEIPFDYRQPILTDHIVIYTNNLSQNVAHRFFQEFGQSIKCVHADSEEMIIGLD